MPQSIRIISHNNGASAKALAAALGNPQLLKKMQPTPTPRFVRDAFIINFGVHEDSTNVSAYVDLNDPDAIETASDKATALAIMQSRGVSVVPYSASPFGVIEQCPEYILGGQPTRTIVARTLTRASEGRGIEMIDCNVDGTARTEVVTAPLYTAYIPKHAEYRVHVGYKGNGAEILDDYKVIDITKKARRTDVPDDQVNWRIRNYDNGFTFAREGIDLAEPTVQRVIDQAKRAVQALGLDFGAVDVVVQSNRERSVYVLEVNTAPGMEGTTLERYVQYFQAVANNQQWTGLTVPASTNIPHASREVVAPAPSPLPVATVDVRSISASVYDALPSAALERAMTPEQARELADFLSQKAEELYTLAG
jgi:hypothetical protein